ncbi:MAG: ribosome maturation factor RimM [Emergencia sp.]
MEKIKIGRIVNAVALRGEVKVYNYSGYRERYEELERIIVDEKEYEIEKVRYQQHMVILKLAGIDDRNGAEAMKNKDVFITEDDLAELPEDTFYIRDLIGLSVVDEESGEKLGVIKDVLQPSSQDVYVVSLEGGGEAMIPAVSTFVKEVSLEGGFVRVALIEGMIEGR